MDESFGEFSELLFDDITITQLDSLPTQELIQVNVTSTDQFSLASDKDLEKLKVDRVPVKTRKQNNWALTVYEQWATWRNQQASTLLGELGLVPFDLKAEPLSKMNYWLSRFIVECRQKNSN
ncbi:hypothetical protein ACF0H5_012843 [Mactra antiquata]